ncbi:MAG: hypothetical protein PW786_03485 [Arachidicoccus sp.]|nr:hypothetical protein [Arachidicoccus sp.]
MELDDLKQAWQQQTPEDIDVRNDKNIIDMIQNKSYGPLASLKAKYERNFYLIAIIYGILIIEFSTLPGRWGRLIHGNKFFSPLVLWLLLAISFASLINQIWCYVLVRKMQNTQTPIKLDLENNLSFINKSLNIQRIVGIITLVGICVVIEFVTYRQRNGDMKTWYNVSFYLRYLAYIGYVALGYFMNKYSYQRQFGKHIDYMKDMLRKME